ncbi:FAD:protein FMN transferase [Psychrobacter sp. T6-5]|uniref:FAD:protein FMN transferase n=1 Tax=Psychrobacter sp. T6-5 TaxID=3457451 RepID=UPI003FD2CE3D
MSQNTKKLATLKLTAMGCHIQITLNVAKWSTPYSQAVIDRKIELLTIEAQQHLARWEHIFSRFDETSELMRLNNHTDQWREVSAELFEVLGRAIYFVAKTQGLITPTLLKPLWAAGYKQSFETLPKMATPSVPVMTSSAAVNATHLKDAPSANNPNHQVHDIQRRRLADGQHQVYLPAGMALDLNGYVKGWCAMQLAEYISRSHDWQLSCLVDMGGDIAIGLPTNQALDNAINKSIVWGVAIAKPYGADCEHMQDDQDVAILSLKSGAVATSGQDYRRWWHEGRWQHHLIHPHYSRPVISDVLTATVVAANTVTAEVYAKYCVLLGVTEAMAWLNKHHIAALLIDTSNQVLLSTAIEPNLIKPSLAVI